MSLVLDASATLSWCFDDASTEAVDRLFDRVVERGAQVPSLWRLEVANGLQVAVRRGRVGPQLRDAFLNQLAGLPIAVDPETDRHAWSTTLRLADRHDLTLYDASYLELARRLSLPLATLDDALRTAAAKAGVDVLHL